MKERHVRILSHAAQRRDSSFSKGAFPKAFFKGVCRLCRFLIDTT